MPAICLTVLSAGLKSFGRLQRVRKLSFWNEPAAGMNPEETADLTRLIKKIQSEYHTAVLLIEHDMSLVMNIAERIYVLDHGHLLAEGNAKRNSG